MVRRKKKLVKRIFSFKVFIFAGVAAGIVIVPPLLKEFYRDYQIDKEIESLKSEIEDMEKNNYQLSKLIEYYNTDEFKESEARKRLNMKKEGESLVIIKPAMENVNISDVFIEEEKREIDVPNYRKWWDYFFKGK